MILSQTKIFNIFLSSVQLGKMLKLLTNNCDREIQKVNIGKKKNESKFLDKIEDTGHRDLELRS